MTSLSSWPRPCAARRTARRYPTPRWATQGTFVLCGGVAAGIRPVATKSLRASARLARDQSPVQVASPMAGRAVTSAVIAITGRVRFEGPRGNSVFQWSSRGCDRACPHVILSASAIQLLFRLLSFHDSLFSVAPGYSAWGVVLSRWVCVVDGRTLHVASGCYRRRSPLFLAWGLSSRDRCVLISLGTVRHVFVWAALSSWVTLSRRYKFKQSYGLTGDQGDSPFLSVGRAGKCFHAGGISFGSQGGTWVTSSAPVFLLYSCSVMVLKHISSIKHLFFFFFFLQRRHRLYQYPLW